MIISPSGETELGLRLTSGGPPDSGSGGCWFWGPQQVTFLASDLQKGIQLLVPATRYTALAAAAVVLPLLGRAPTTTRYRIDQSLSQEMDATPAGGAKKKIAFTTSSFVTVSLADSAGGKVMRV